MANPLRSEVQIYERIKKENIKVHPLVWELIDHHIGNDIHIIQFIVGSHVIADKPESVPPEHGKKVLHQCDEVKKFLIRLREATKDQTKKD
jgi:hypothetical protein